MVSAEIPFRFEMQCVDWVQGLKLDEPVYMDASILVGSLISSHPLYGKCATLIGELLAENVEITLSMVAVDESIWIMAKLAYCDIHHHPPSGVHWNPGIYHKNRERIFQSHGSWIEAVRDAVKDWASAGARIDIVPRTRDMFEDALDLVTRYMREVKLTPADAIHLALAQKHAKSFLTADSDFDEVRQNPPAGDLLVVKLTA